MLFTYYERSEASTVTLPFWLFCFDSENYTTLFAFDNPLTIVPFDLSRHEELNSVAEVFATDIMVYWSHDYGECRCR